MELFDRTVELLIGISQGNEALKIKNLCIEFDITKGADTKDNTATAKIKVYNCNQSTTNLLLTIGRHIVLKAGYKGINSGRDPLVLFNGNISKAFVEKSKSDRVINIEAIDGVNDMINSSFSYSFIENTDVYTVVKKVTEIMGFTTKGLENSPDNAQVYSTLKSSFYYQGYAYFGMAKDCLKEVLNRVGLTYSIQNEILYIHFPNTKIQNLGFVIKTSTGLLSVPQQLFEEKDEQVNTDRPRWKFKALLYPQLIPNSVCRVESSTLNGEVLIREAHFQGSNMRGEFSVELMVEQL